jgi:ABC-type protease/lipase transport system fused ATPase/permease subunit
VPCLREFWSGQSVLSALAIAFVTITYIIIVINVLYLEISFYSSMCTDYPRAHK